MNSLCLRVVNLLIAAALSICTAASAFGQLNLPSTIPVPWGPALGLGEETLFASWAHTSPGTSDVMRLAFSGYAIPDTLGGAKEWKLWYQISNDNGASYDTIRPLIQDGVGYDQRHPIDPVYIEPDFPDPRQNSFVMSASPPITMSNGQMLVPFNFWPYDENDDHELAHVNETFTYHNSGVLIGTWAGDRSDVTWDLGLAPPLDFDTQSRRGEIEPSVAELQKPGRIVMSMRGSNNGDVTLPSLAWKSVSDDFGQTWSQTEELTYTDGTPFFSPSAMSTFLRNEHNQRLYWFGNIIPSNANGNSPRYPLVIAEVDEQSLGIIQSTVQVIADKQPGDLSTIQFSNFRITENVSNGIFTVEVPRVGNGQSGKDFFAVAPPVSDNGDFDFNGSVNGADFLTWQRGVNNFSGNASLLDGDADGNGSVGASDLNIFQGQFGNVATIPTTPVPITANLLIQLDGTDVTATGSLVDSWNDQASKGGAENFTQTGAARPTLATGVALPNGTIRDVVEFSGSETLRLGADADLDNLGTQSWYMVVRFDTGSTNSDQNVFGENYSASPTKLSTGLTSGNAGHVLRNAGGSQDVNTGSTPYAPSDGEWVLISGQWNMTAGTVNGFGPEKDTIFVHDSAGTLRSAGTRVNVDGLPGTHVQSILGNRGDTHALRFFEGALAEFLVYDDILTSAEQALVQNYLLDKYFLGAGAISAATAVPEPASILLLGIGCLMMLGTRKKIV